MKNNAFLVGLVLSPLSACAPYQLPPLTMAHPAHAEAGTAPAPAASQTLVYAQTDIPSPNPIRETPAAQVKNHDQDHQSRTGAEKTVSASGKIIAAVPSSNQVVLEHGEIPGFMSAMTMGYPVEAPALLEGLSPGDQVRFTIDVQKKTVTKIEKQ